MNWNYDDEDDGDVPDDDCQDESKLGLRAGQVEVKSSNDGMSCFMLYPLEVLWGLIKADAMD